MKTLSIQQPFASAIVSGPKRVENRTWRVRLPRGGLWLAVHASRGMFPGVDLDLVRGLWPEMPEARDLPRGAIIGAMLVVEIVHINDMPDDPWASGPWCWVISEALALREPIVASGSRGLWDAPERAVRVLEDL